MMKEESSSGDSDCFQCTENAEYYCRECETDFCLQCKEKHFIDLDFHTHDLITIEMKYETLRMCYITCERHPYSVYNRWCRRCKRLFCIYCKGHKNHSTVEIQSAYEQSKSKSRKNIAHIRSITLPYNIALLDQMRNNLSSNVKECQLETTRHFSKMTERAETVKSTLNFVQNLDLSSFENIVERVRHLERFVISTQKSVDHLETYASKPVTWLSYFKKCPIPASENFPDAYVKPSINLSALDRDNVIQMFGEVEVINTGKKCIGNECLFEVFSDVVLNETVEVDGIWKSLHISCVTPERFWTSNHRKLLLVLKNDRVLYREKDVLIDADFPCVHSVTRTGELIYIDKRHNVKKVEREKKLHVTRILIARTHPWKPCSLYCSNLNDDLLIGMWSRKNDASMVARFDRSGRPKQNVRYNEQGKPLYKRALYITENQNGDVIVSDLWNGVVVVNGEGKYRFSYKSPPSGQRLSPHGVCTDVLMHVLICDYNTNCVQMIDKDGNFLRFLLTNRNDMNEPRSLFYDNKNHLLWVGSQDKNTKLSIYRYINRKNLY